MTQSDNDGLPTMGQEAENALAGWRCTCGSPETEGVMHRVDGPCTVPERTAEQPTETYADRLKIEAVELDQRGMKLSAFVKGNPSFGKLPVRDRELLVMQLNAMSTYYNILTERLFRAVNPEMAAKADAAEAEERAQQLNDLAKHTGGINGAN